MVPVASASPVADVTDPHGARGFIGDAPAKAHGILWDKASYLAKKGGVPDTGETAQVVVVGGGIAGLTAAYRLRDFKPIVLEQGKQFGGNAKGERWNDLVYSIGSAYIPRPEKGTALGDLFDELGLREHFRFESSRDEGVLLSGHAAGADGAVRVAAPFWSGASVKAGDEAGAADIRRVYQRLLDFEAESYPTIPPRNEAERERVEALDRVSFAEWVQKNLGKIHPHVEELFHEYCWDSMGGGYDELSAAQVLNFLTADLAGGMGALPGGNSAISSALYERLAGSDRSPRLRNEALTVDVSANAHGVRVCYEDAKGKLRSIQAKACIVTSPKFVAKTIVSNLPADQLAAMRALRYRAFIVANVLINGKVESPHYGVFRITGEVPSGPDNGDAARAFTSMIFGAWAQGNQTGSSSLTLYKAFPFEEGRASLSPHSAYAKVRSRFEREIPGLLASIGVDPSRVAGLRLARWGHALPLAAPGLLASGVLEKASRPVAERIFFAQQDNWANPSVETSVTTAVAAAAAVRARLSKSEA
ncbi:MAG: FAD-dependent oxidoreductase [Deltaproteobacteria bacterium]|nr:FAD-dependent oxidoreductase [Deltaproteobacteria bacterium]